MPATLDEGLMKDGLFGPDTVALLQYFDTYGKNRNLEPEKKLVLAVLEDGISTYQKYIGARDQKGKVLFNDAEEWILNSDDADLFSFNNVCECLGYNPDYIRRGILRWGEDARSGKKEPLENIIDRSKRAKKTILTSQT